MPLDVLSEGELQREDNSSGRTKAIMIPAATSVEAPYTPTDDLESVSDDVGPDTPDGVSPVMVKSATSYLDVKVMADITRQWPPAKMSQRQCMDRKFRPKRRKGQN